MKKIIAIIAILMLVPFTAFGLEALSEDVLDDVTGQAGVSINLDVHVDATIDTAAWGDADGVAGTTANGAYIGMQSMNIDNLRVRARDDWALGLGAPTFATGRLTPRAGDLSDLRLLTIDVAQDDTMYGGASFVRIGTGTLQISMTEFSATVGLADGATITDIDEVLGTVFVGDMNVFLNDSRIDIYAHGESGVTMDFDISVDLIAIETISWGDTDGLQTPAYGVPGAVLPAYSADAADTAAGYVGIKNLVMDNLTITGAVSIDVLTVVGNAGAGGQTPVGLYFAYINGPASNPGNISNTYVHLAFNNIVIGLDEMSGIVALGADQNLDTANGQLGNFYIDNVSATVNGWVDVFADRKSVV